MYVSYFNSSWCHKCGSCAEEEEGRKQLSPRMFSLGRGEDIFHSYVYLSCEIADSNDTFLENKRQTRT